MSKPKLRVKSGDEVVVLTGKDKGKTGRILRVLPDDRSVVVEGVRRVKRHQRPVGERPGGIVYKEMPIDVSNVALWNATEGRPVKVAFRINDNGQKVRVDRKTGNPVD